MPLKLLVAGLLEHDSGKTWLAAALALTARRHGLRVAAYKPVGGFDAWGSYKAFRESTSMGALAGNDALTYHRVLGEKPERINPVALLLAPRDPLFYSGPASYLADSARLESSLVLARITGCDGRSRHLVFKENLERAPITLRAEVAEAASRLGAEPGDTTEFLSWLGSAEASKLFSSCLAEVSRDAQLVLIESFNDAASPYLPPPAIDFTIIVVPGKALLYSGERVERAINYTALHTPPRVARIMSLLGSPLASIDLPPALSIEEYSSKLESSKIARLILD